MTTKLRCHKNSQYAFEQPASHLETFSFAPIEMSLLLGNNMFIGTAAEALPVGVAVFQGSLNENWHYGYSEIANGGYIKGITITSSDAGEQIIIAGGGDIDVTGIAGFDSWNWTCGEYENIYCRAIKGTTTGSNLSQNELTAKTGTEDFYIKIGHPISGKKIVLDFSEQWEFE